MLGKQSSIYKDWTWQLARPGSEREGEGFSLREGEGSVALGRGSLRWKTRVQVGCVCAQMSVHVCAWGCRDRGGCAPPP